jgi:hypothetical protein
MDMALGGRGEADDEAVAAQKSIAASKVES